MLDIYGQRIYTVLVTIVTTYNKANVLRKEHFILHLYSFNMMVA